MQSVCPGEGLDELLRRFQCALDCAAALLSHPDPESIDASEAPLSEACDALRRYCELAPEVGDGAGRSQTGLMVRREFERVESLLRHAQGFHQGWIQTVAAGASGYTAEGAPDISGAARTISIEG